MAWVKNKQFSSWQKLIQRVPEESVLGPLFNIYQNGLFYLAESTNVCIFTNVYTFAQPFMHVMKFDITLLTD